MKTTTLVKMSNSGNHLQTLIKKIFNYTICILFSVALLLLPFTVSTEDFSIESITAFAKGGGGGAGGGGGNGGGNGGGGNVGNGGGHGNNGNGNANGHGTASNHGATASELGSLNASHASQNGMANAAPNSNVGQISAAIAESTNDDGTVSIEGLSEALGVSSDVALAVAENAGLEAVSDNE